MKILIIGGKGFIGSRCAEIWPDAVVADRRVECEEDVRALLVEHQPDAVLNAAGVVGKPNVDWCETHQLETIRGNTELPIMIARVCQEAGVYLLHVATGCVFYGYSENISGWTEHDFPNPSAVYTRSKYAADLVLSTLPHVGIARIRMPIDSRPSPGNLIDKLASYPRVIDVVNSVTIIPDMVQVFRQLIEKKGTGIFHVVNPGALTHREILGMYEETVDAHHTNEWLTADELVSAGLAKGKRSNTLLASPRLQALGIVLPEVHDSLQKIMKEYAVLKK